MPSNRKKPKSPRARPMPSRYEVFKIQREIIEPLAVHRASFDGETKVLVYNKDRSITGQFPITPELRKLFGKRLKIYVLGRRLPDGRLETGDRALDEWEDW